MCAVCESTCTERWKHRPRKFNAFTLNNASSCLLLVICGEQATEKMGRGTCSLMPKKSPTCVRGGPGHRPMYL